MKSSNMKVRVCSLVNNKFCGVKSFFCKRPQVNSLIGANLCDYIAQSASKRQRRNGTEAETEEVELSGDNKAMGKASRVEELVFLERKRVRAETDYDFFKNDKDQFAFGKNAFEAYLRQCLQENVVEEESDESEGEKSEAESEDERLIEEVDAGDDDQKFGCIKPDYAMYVQTSNFEGKYNAPPRKVLRCKLDIVYRNLQDKSKTPKYFLEEDVGRNKLSVLRFQGGLPYEDIRFRVLSGELECLGKNGFKSFYDGEVLHFYFNLKR